MGYTTDFVGHIDIDPPLNEHEVTYLQAFCSSRRFVRDSPYDVPGNPWAETGEGIEIELYNMPHPGQPGLWCNWEVSWDGRCITWSGNEKSYAMVAWLRYLIQHFLKPGARAARDPRFAEFTFDHRLTGVMVGCRRDNKELFMLRVTNNRVTEKVIVPADPRYALYPPLAYEEAKDREDKALRRRRRPLPDEEQPRLAVVK